MELLNEYQINDVNGGYGTCEVVRDGTTGFFSAAGAIIGGATNLGFGAAAGGFLGHMVGSWAADIVYEDCTGTYSD